MHVGHLRTTVIGDSLVRIYAFLGHRSIRENHIGDWGTPFGMLIEHLLDEGADARHGHRARRPDGVLPGRPRASSTPTTTSRTAPASASSMLQSGDARDARAVAAAGRREQPLLRSGLPRARRAAHRRRRDGRERTTTRCSPTCIDRLREPGLLEESDGAEVVFPPGYKNREGDPLPLIVRRRTAASTTRRATSPASSTALERRAGRPAPLRRRRAAGAAPRDGVQGRRDGRLADAARTRRSTSASATSSAPTARCCGPAAATRSSSTSSSTRRSSAARAQVAGEEPRAARRTSRPSVGRMIGIGAIKYADLSTDRIKDYVFDWERMLSFDGNTAPYLQYAHARIRSIFRRAERRPRVGAARSRRRSTEPAGARARAAAARVRRRGHRDGRALHPAPAVHLPVRARAGLHRVLRGVPRAARRDAGAPRQPARARATSPRGCSRKGLDLLGIEAPERM